MARSHQASPGQTLSATGRFYSEATRIDRLLLRL